MEEKMSISMVGIDYNKASVDIRAQFSFTKKNAAAAMEKLKEAPGILGCIILSTCNRMEIWASTQEEWEGSLFDFLCEEKGKNPEEFRRYFVERREEEAIEHLFYLTSGLKSQILAEDQIITQVKDALSMARDVYCTDNVLEVLFRMAVTAAKRVKTEVVFSRGNSSVIHQAIQKLRETGYSLDGSNCMVIGNGEMGKVAALALAEAGAHVTVTVRQYRSGIVSIPKGCDRINYGERMEFFPSCDLIVSATASPNFTLTKELIQQAATGKKQQILIDLAVPRDIEPSVNEIEGITLYDIDSFKIDTNSLELQESMQKAAAILREQMEDFYCWYDGRSLIPRIQDIQAEAVQDLNLRILKILRKTPMEDEDRENLLNAIDVAAGKVVSKMMFGLRDTLEKEEFINCVEGLEKLYGA
ncbi:glutamyl-tRNA reductase [Blautia hansenii DSM 20583]|jgi:glutamyl-tRNA reductase|uniref:Glutamyl-tRNA reductase n=2 Tax=Blautia hansenii TaxID=1322 RepID=C9L8U1_BLAHA|nr:glutamyl-tRNA reductase [Blautia hansenii]EEX21490.1 glutamyl-tRNA reductase [Blautia hansenii DSM 20583]